MFALKFVALLISSLSISVGSVSPPPRLPQSSKFKDYPVPCKNNMDCPLFSKCETGRCLCITINGTSHDHEADECRRDYGTACDLNGRSPPDCRTGYECVDNNKSPQCSCTPGSIWAGSNGCVSAIACKEDKDCPVVAMECSSSHKCECKRKMSEPHKRFNPEECGPTSYKFKDYPERGRCKKNIDCPLSSKCVNYPRYNSRRDLSSRCECFQGTSYDSEADECRRDPETGCDLNGRSPPDCKTGFACVESTKGSQCQCEKGKAWDKNNRICVPAIECKDRSDCPTFMRCSRHKCECKLNKWQRGYNPANCEGGIGDPCDLDLNDSDYATVNSTLPDCSSDLYCVANPKEPGTGICKEKPDRSSTAMTVMFALLLIEVVALGVFLILIAVYWYK